MIPDEILGIALTRSHLLWLALFGLFYHLGVRMAGVPLKMSADDEVDALISLRLHRDIPAPAIFIAALVVLGMMVLASIAERIGTFDSMISGYKFVSRRKADVR